MSKSILLRRIDVKYQYTIRAVCAYAHDFQKRTGCALIGACLLIRTNTVIKNSLRSLFEPGREKTCLRGFRQSATQTGLRSHRKRLEA